MKTEESDDFPLFVAFIIPQKRFFFKSRPRSMVMVKLLSKGGFSMDKNRSMFVKQTEYELREHGYALSKEDVDDLIKTQEFAYKACKMIDFSHDIVFELATVFVQSPYIQPTTYVPLLKNLLYAYYKIRKSVGGYIDK